MAIRKRGSKSTSRSARSSPSGATPDAATAQLDAVFHALADHTRRRVIALLREAGELKVGDIAHVFVMSLNGVSKHLKVLEAAGLVRREVRGREHWLSVAWAGLQPAHGWLSSHEPFWRGRLDALAQHFESDPKPKRRKSNPTKSKKTKTKKRDSQ